MNTKIIMVLSLLAVLSILMVGCKSPTATETTAPVSGELSSGDLSEEKVAVELDELDQLEQQSQELDDIDLDVAEEAVKE